MKEENKDFGKSLYSDGSIKILSDCEKQMEVGDKHHPRWKYWIVGKIGKLLNMTLRCSYPNCYNRKGKYYDVVNEEFFNKDGTPYHNDEDVPVDYNNFPKDNFPCL